MSKLRVCTARLDSTRREVVRLRVDECLHGRIITAGALRSVTSGFV